MTLFVKKEASILDFIRNIKLDTVSECEKKQMEIFLAFTNPKLKIGCPVSLAYDKSKPLLKEFYQEILLYVRSFNGSGFQAAKLYNEVKKKAREEAYRITDPLLDNASPEAFNKVSKDTEVDDLPQVFKDILHLSEQIEGQIFDEQYCVHIYNYIENLQRPMH